MAFREDPFGTDDALMPPELPSPELRDPSVRQFITHHDGSELILSAQSAGIPESRFNHMFDFHVRMWMDYTRNLQAQWMDLQQQLNPPPPVLLFT